MVTKCWNTAACIISRNNKEKRKYDFCHSASAALHRGTRDNAGSGIHQGRLLLASTKGKMTLHRQIFQQGGSSKRERNRHCQPGQSTLDLCLHSESCWAIHLPVLQLDCAWVLYFRYFNGLIGHMTALSFLKDRGDYHCIYDRALPTTACEYRSALLG